MINVSFLNHDSVQGGIDEKKPLNHGKERSEIITPTILI